MATIEPRLMHLLNVTDRGHALPPMQLLPFSGPSTGTADSASASADAAAASAFAPAIPSFGASAPPASSTFINYQLFSPAALLPPPDVDPRLSAAVLKKKISTFWSLPAEDNILLPQPVARTSTAAGGGGGLHIEPGLLLLPKEPLSSTGRAGAGLAGPPPPSTTSHGASNSPPKLPAYPPHALHTPTDASATDTAALANNNNNNNNNVHLVSFRMLFDDIAAAPGAMDESTPPAPAPAPLTDDPTTKKRVAKDDFVQLPQPLKKQKSTPQVMPPIINGLHEPPPNAAVFPPMQQSQPSRAPSEPSPAAGAAPSNESAAANVAAANNLHAIWRDFPLAIGAGAGGGSSSAAVEELPVNNNNNNSNNNNTVSSLLSPTSAVSPWAAADAAGGPVQAASPSDADVEGKTADGAAGKTGAKRRAPRPRRKWTDEETNSLLLGVSRWGVGKWRNILEDADFHDKFNDRSAGDLKDRFRTCCPDELRGGSGKNKENTNNNGQSKDYRQQQLSTVDPGLTPTTEAASMSSRQKVDFFHHAHILIDADEQMAAEGEKDESHSPSATTVTTTTSEHHQEDSDSAAATTPSTSTPAAPKPRKSRAHRKKMEDLKELGICAPFKKSHRRERRPFSDEDDGAILRGLYVHGPAWTKIQRDPNFGLLASRQPTDLRDRVRNKYPDAYAMIEKGNWPVSRASGSGSARGGSSRGSRKGHTPRNSGDSTMEKFPGSSPVETTAKPFPGPPLPSTTYCAAPEPKAERSVLLEKSSNESMLSCGTNSNSGSATSPVLPRTTWESSEYLPAGGSMAAAYGVGLGVRGGAEGATPIGHGHGDMDISRLLLNA